MTSLTVYIRNLHSVASQRPLNYRLTLMFKNGKKGSRFIGCLPYPLGPFFTPTGLPEGAGVGDGNNCPPPSSANIVVCACVLFRYVTH